MYASGLFRRWEQGLSTIDDTPEINPHEPFEILVGHKLLHDHTHPGIVDNAVNLAKFLNHVIAPGGDLGAFETSTKRV